MTRLIAYLILCLAIAAITFTRSYTATGSEAREASEPSASTRTIVIAQAEQLPRAAEAPKASAKPESVPARSDAKAKAPYAPPHVKASSTARPAGATRGIHLGGLEPLEPVEGEK